MLEVHTCEDCGKDIKANLSAGFAHIACANCKQKYTLCRKSVKIYIFLPFLCVGISVYLSTHYLHSDDIFIKMLFIFSVSYILYVGLCLLLKKVKLLQYEKKE